MKLNWNRKYLTIAAYATGSVIVSAVVIMAIINFDEFMSRISVLGAVATPIVIGIFCAYLLNPLMTKFEKGLFKRLSSSESSKKRGRARVFSLTLTMLTVVLALTLVVVMVIPQLIVNLVTVFSNMDSYIATVREFLDGIFEDYPAIREFLGNPLDDFSAFIRDLWNRYSSELLGFAGNIASGVWALLDTMKNVIVGLIISIYLLAKKEMFIGQSKKLIFAFLSVEHAQRFLSVCREASKKFLGSIIGKVLESLLVAAICFIGCAIMGMPYSLLMSVIMFVFNLIPFVGPFIGAVPCVLLLLLSDSPIMALWFLIFIVILQNVDGNIISPWILGDSTGLPAVWILIAILVGGGFFGILGMFLGVPVCAVLYMLFKDFIEGRLRKRKLPQGTTEYAGDVSFITPGFVCEEPEHKPVPEEPHKYSFKEIIHDKKELYRKRLHIPQKNNRKKTAKKKR